MFQPDATRAATLGAVSHPCAEQFWLAFRRRRWRSRVGGCGAGRTYAAIASIRIRGPPKAPRLISCSSLLQLLRFANYLKIVFNFQLDNSGLNIIFKILF